MTLEAITQRALYRCMEAGLFLQLDLLYELPAQHKLKQEFSSCGVSGQGGASPKVAISKGKLMINYMFFFRYIGISSKL